MPVFLGFLIRLACGPREELEKAVETTLRAGGYEVRGTLECEGTTGSVTGRVVRVGEPAELPEGTEGVVADCADLRARMSWPKAGRSFRLFRTWSGTASRAGRSR